MWAAACTWGDASLRQIPLAIAPHATFSFDGFVAPPGSANAAALAHLRGPLRAPVYVWGPASSGKSHLLRALAHSVQAQGGRVAWFGANTPTPWPFDAAWQLIVLDDCERFNALQQQAAFTLLIEAASPPGVQVAAAGALPPVDLPLRDDLRTRLGWGHVFALEPLNEEQMRAALRREADRRGIFLSDEVMHYLLTRFSRDLKHLMDLLDRLDEFALAERRAVTVPLLKRMFEEEGHRL
jgi:DnaA-homolog protein